MSVIKLFVEQPQLHRIKHSTVLPKHKFIISSIMETYESKFVTLVLLMVFDLVS